jgi:tRNA(adenine34) deaminase
MPSSFSISHKEYLKHRQYMSKVLEVASIASKLGEVPVGALIVDHLDNILSIKGNSKQNRQDPTAHAEILAIQTACHQLGTWRLDKCTMYVNLEPCPMCAGAIIQARVGQLVYSLDNPKTGSIRTLINLPDGASSNHRLKVISGIMELEAREQMQSWFEQALRANTKSTPK